MFKLKHHIYYKKIYLIFMKTYKKQQLKGYNKTKKLIKTDIDLLLLKENYPLYASKKHDGDKLLEFKRNAEKESKDHFSISIKEPAERGLANKRVIELVREYFKVYNKDIRIVSGHHSPGKIISIDNN